MLLVFKFSFLCTCSLLQWSIGISAFPFISWMTLPSHWTSLTLCSHLQGGDQIGPPLGMLRYKQHRTWAVDGKTQTKPHNNSNRVVHLFPFITYFFCNYKSGPESQMIWINWFMKKKGKGIVFFLNPFWLALEASVCSLPIDCKFILQITGPNPDPVPCQCCQPLTVCQPWGQQLFHMLGLISEQLAGSFFNTKTIKQSRRNCWIRQSQEP